jgi:hypothetical protein
MKFGPKLSAPPEGLDNDSQERLDAFTWMAGDRQLVRTRRLVWLAVTAWPKVDLKVGSRFKKTGETVVLSPHTMIMTEQEAIGAARVNHYVGEYASGKPIKPIKVTDIDPSGWWHLDGLHRLLAARILGMSVEAKVYR